VPAASWFLPLGSCGRDPIEPGLHRDRAIPSGDGRNADRQHARRWRYSLLRRVVPGHARAGSDDGARQFGQLVDPSRRGHFEERRL